MAKDKAAAKKKDEAEDEEKPAPETGGDEAETAAAGEGGEGEEKASKFAKLFAGKRKFIVIGVLAVLLLGGGAGVHFSGMLGAKKPEAPGGESERRVVRENKDGKHYFYDLGDMLVNLSGEGKRPSFLKLKISIEIEDEKDKAMMEQVKPRILDNFQVYLRELRIDDLKGSAGIYRLREELLLRVTEAAHPARVRDILITEMLVQ